MDNNIVMIHYLYCQSKTCPRCNATWIVDKDKLRRVLYAIIIVDLIAIIIVNFKQ